MRQALLFGLAAGCLQPAGYFDDLRDTHADPDGDGWTAAQGDCGPHDPSVAPFFPEVCDDKDNDCDGQVDEEPADAEAWFDGDADGFGDPSVVVVTCAPPSGFVAGGEPDCDDDAAQTFPDADERCDAADNDCDGRVDEDPAVDAPTWFLDVDGDGYGNAVDAVTTCAPPSEEWVLNGDDCAPTDPEVHPAAVEVCNGEDDDCDGLADNPPVSGDTLWYPDVDRDGYGDASAPGVCEPEPGFVSNNQDCGDRDREVKPGAEEVCNDGLDNDCSGVAEGCEWPSVVDLDDRVHGIAVANTTGTAFGTGIGVYDLDGDGRANLVIGGGGSVVAGAAARGAVFAWPVPVSAPTTTASAAVWKSHDAEVEFFGSRLAHGDLDGDGLMDTVVAAQGASVEGLGVGAVLVGIGPLDPLGGRVDDGFASGWFHEGSYRDGFGGALRVGPDVTGDGLDDVLVGIEASGGGAGAALLLSGVPAASVSAWDAADAQITGQAGSALGACVALGDVDGDGAGDIIVGAPQADGRGAVLVFLGPAVGARAAEDADTEIRGARSGALLGEGCAVLGDMAGDGLADVAVGGPGDGMGSVAVFTEGLPAGVLAASAAPASLVGSAAGSGGFFGASVHPAGDLNQDGAPDLVVGEVQWDPLAARVWFGPLSGVQSDVDADVTVWLPYTDSVGYLRELHGGDDLTGDGVPDLVVADEARGEGRVWLLPGVGF
jgi:hypothetical protein